MTSATPGRSTAKLAVQGQRAAQGRVRDPCPSAGISRAGPAAMEQELEQRQWQLWVTLKSTLVSVKPPYKGNAHTGQNLRNAERHTSVTNTCNHTPGRHNSRNCLACFLQRLFWAHPVLQKCILIKFVSHVIFLLTLYNENFPSKFCGFNNDTHSLCTASQSITFSVLPTETI